MKKIPIEKFSPHLTKANIKNNKKLNDEIK